MDDKLICPCGNDKFIFKINYFLCPKCNIKIIVNDSIPSPTEQLENIETMTRINKFLQENKNKKTINISNEIFAC